MGRVSVGELVALGQAAAVAGLEDFDGCFDTEVGFAAVGGTVLVGLERGLVLCLLMCGGIGGLEGAEGSRVEVEGLGGLVGERVVVVVEKCLVQVGLVGGG